METPTEQQPPAAPPAPPAAPPAPAAAPAAPPRAAAPKPKGKQPAHREPVVTIPQKALKERIDREARSIVAKRLGVSLDEAEKIVKAGPPAAAAPATSTPSQQAQGQADQAIAKMRLENERLKKELNETRNKVGTLEKKNQRTYDRMRDRIMETELKAEAAQAGIRDVDYAITLYARAVRAATAEAPAPESVGFFTGLRQTHKYLFDGAAPAPRPVPASTAPPESPAPGEVTPQPSPAGAPPSTKSVDDMSPQEFAAHTGRYGYRPGM